MIDSSYYSPELSLLLTGVTIVTIEMVKFVVTSIASQRRYTWHKNSMAIIEYQPLLLYLFVHIRSMADPKIRFCTHEQCCFSCVVSYQSA